MSGTVSFQEELLDHGSLRFFGADGRPIGSVIREDGTFQIDLAPGQYQVSVSSPPMPPVGEENLETPPPVGPNDKVLPAKYTQPESSGLSLMVNSQAEPMNYDIGLE